MQGIQSKVDMSLQAKLNHTSNFYLISSSLSIWALCFSKNGRKKWWNSWPFSRWAVPATRPLAPLARDQGLVAMASRGCLRGTSCLKWGVFGDDIYFILRWDTFLGMIHTYSKYQQKSSDICLGPGLSGLQTAWSFCSSDRHDERKGPGNHWGYRLSLNLHAFIHLILNVSRCFKE